VVFIAKASEPEEASERQNDPRVSVDNRGMYFSINMGEAYLRKTVLTRVLCTSHKTETEASTLASSV
jgi:hypothetical protein